MFKRSALAVQLLSIAFFLSSGAAASAAEDELLWRGDAVEIHVLGLAAEHGPARDAAVVEIVDLVQRQRLHGVLRIRDQHGRVERDRHEVDAGFLGTLLVLRTRAAGDVGRALRDRVEAGDRRERLQRDLALLLLRVFLRELVHDRATGRVIAAPEELVLGGRSGRGSAEEKRDGKELNGESGALEHDGPAGRKIGATLARSHGRCADAHGSPRA
jgi:hypothetical protein